MNLPRTKRQPGSTAAAKQSSVHLGIAERTGNVAVVAAAEHHLERESFVVDAAGRPHDAAMQEAAVAPEVGGGEQEKARLVAAG